MSIDITLDELWAPIRDSLIAQKAPERQRREMKKAFFCGAHRVMSVLAEKLPDDLSDLSDEDNERIAAQLQTDLEAYVEGGWREDPEFAPVQPGEDS